MFALHDRLVCADCQHKYIVSPHTVCHTMQILCPYAKKCTVFGIGAGIIKNVMEKMDSGRLERVVVLVVIELVCLSDCFLLHFSKLVCMQRRSIDETDSRMNLTCICCVSSITPWVARLPLCLKYFTSACKSYDPAA